MIPWDLSLVLSIVALALSILTLWLSEFRGPNLSLLNTPRFEATDEAFAEHQTKEYTPRWFRLTPVPFMFANYGGKAGTILDLKFDFVPHAPFKIFLDEVYFNLTKPDGLPITIEEGDNQYLEFSPEFRTIEWKRVTLAEVLDPNLKVDDIIEKTLERSKESFEDFCDFLTKSQELGRVACTITLTTGRFRTKVKKKTLLKNVIVANRYDKTVSTLRDCLRRWENLHPIKLELLNRIKGNLEELVREFKENSTTLRTSVDGGNIDKSKLKVNAWKRLHGGMYSYERKVRWFLIDSEERLKADLSGIYENIVKYNDLIDESLSLGDLRTEDDFNRINTGREDLLPDMQKMWKGLSSLHKRALS